MDCRSKANVDNVKDNRKRNWDFVFYPESAPDNWMSIIDDWHVPCFISPLHDQDVNTTGEKKKAHWHGILMFSGKQTFESVRDLVALLNAPIPQACKDVRGSARYLCHLDNPSKHQYDTSNVISFGGADYLDVISLVSDKYSIIQQMIYFVKENQVEYFVDLMEYAAENNDEWFHSLCNNSAYILEEVIKSNSYKLYRKRS